MKELRTIDDLFVDEYILNHRNKLSKPVIGGTDWRFADIVAPAFKEMLEISNPLSILEIGFNIGGSALMFLSINPSLTYHSIDINYNHKSVEYLSVSFPKFNFIHANSKEISKQNPHLLNEYDLAIIDGDHTYDGVVNDIEKTIPFNPKYFLFDDVLHPSHSYIHDIITNKYSDVLGVDKLYEFHQCWQGYSFALCRNKNIIR